MIDHIHDQVGQHRMGIISELMPDNIREMQDKIASEDTSNLPDAAFAHSTITDRYFPLHTPEHVCLSGLYFTKCASSIEENLRKDIQFRIQDAAEAFGIDNPIKTDLTKEASSEDNVDYLHRLALDINDFINGYKKHTVEERRKIALELQSRALKLKHSTGTPELIKRYGGKRLVEDYPKAFAARMQHFPDKSEQRRTLLELQMLAGEHIPEVLAKTLHLFDKKFNLDKHYDTSLSDPYYSLLIGGECEEEPVCSYGTHSLFPSEVKNYDYSKLSDLFDDDLVSSLKDNLPATLKSIDPTVKVIIIKRIKGL